MSKKPQQNEAEKENNVVDMEQFRRKRARLKARRVLIILAVVLVLLVAGAVFAYKYINKV